MALCRCCLFLTLGSLVSEVSLAGMVATFDALEELDKNRFHLGGYHRAGVNRRNATKVPEAAATAGR